MSLSPVNTTLNSLEKNQLRESLRRCSEATILATLEFQQTRSPELTLQVVVGILERYVDPELRPCLLEAGAELRLVEDLALDSLTMVEIVMLVEEVLGITVSNEEVRSLRTVGDIRAFIDGKAAPKALDPAG